MPGQKSLDFVQQVNRYVKKYVLNGLRRRCGCEVAGWIAEALQLGPRNRPRLGHYTQICRHSSG